MNTLFKLTFGLLIWFVKFVVTAVFADGGKANNSHDDKLGAMNYKYFADTDEYVSQIDYDN
ncbi:hypothetical protein [Alteromonas sp. ASW11-130]|uniref:hypothetical protein n=1 Tax=Alteromonas sp. ASW11-130 TaxID=3015775 RepID=UPI0022421073|nr:hypothetical protein [Alteromonas sp. ASW11-130]MCW8090681.1 hypothetical protein [Alteromonas sp. ASW11-130]